MFLRLIPGLSSPRGLGPLTPGPHLYTCGSSETSIGNVRPPFHQRPTFQVVGLLPQLQDSVDPKQSGWESRPYLLLRSPHFLLFQ